MLVNDPDKLTPLGMSSLRWQDTEAIFRDDDGQIPMPVLATHHSLARGYGRDMWELGLTPRSLIEQAQKAPDPVRHLLSVLDHVTGYREDALRKKAMLLAIALGQRPERFIDLEGSASVTPIIDYHLMRSCLRTGLVEVGDEALREQLVGRRLLAPADEFAIRMACYEAVGDLMRVSERSMVAIDWFFFGARERCPEMEEPECARCPIDPVCKHDKAMFQPVYRTTFY